MRCQRRPLVTPSWHTPLALAAARAMPRVVSLTAAVVAAAAVAVAEAEAVGLHVAAAAVVEAAGLQHAAAAGHTQLTQVLGLTG